MNFIRGEDVFDVVCMDIHDRIDKAKWKVNSIINAERKEWICDCQNWTYMNWLVVRNKTRVVITVSNSLKEGIQIQVKYLYGSAELNV